MYHGTSQLSFLPPEVKLQVGKALLRESRFSFPGVLAARKRARASYEGRGIVVFVPIGLEATSVTEVCLV